MFKIRNDDTIKFPVATDDPFLLQFEAAATATASPASTCSSCQNPLKNSSFKRDLDNNYVREHDCCCCCQSEFVSSDDAQQLESRVSVDVDFQDIQGGPSIKECDNTAPSVITENNSFLSSNCSSSTTVSICFDSSTDCSSRNSNECCSVDAAAASNEFVTVSNNSSSSSRCLFGSDRSSSGQEKEKEKKECCNRMEEKKDLFDMKEDKDEESRAEESKASCEIKESKGSCREGAKDTKTDPPFDHSARYVLSIVAAIAITNANFVPLSYSAVKIWKTSQQLSILY